MARIKIDSISIVGLALFCFMMFRLLQDVGNDSGTHPPFAASAGKTSAPATFVIGMEGTNNSIETPVLTVDVANPNSSVLSQDESPTLQEQIAAPYERYAVTQGPHGFSYGHTAVDLSAGKGAEIKSPINGWVSANYVDDWGNTTLIVENDIYQVTILHGIFTPNVGDQVTMGQMIGYESNQGITVDSFGRSCRGRDCGYHIHINIFDKILGINVNPLDLFGS